MLARQNHLQQTTWKLWKNIHLASSYLTAKIAKFTLQGYALVHVYLDPGHLIENKIVTEMTEQHAF